VSIHPQDDLIEPQAPDECLVGASCKIIFGKLKTPYEGKIACRGKFCRCTKVLLNRMCWANARQLEIACYVKRYLCLCAPPPQSLLITVAFYGSI